MRNYPCFGSHIEGANKCTGCSLKKTCITTKERMAMSEVYTAESDIHQNDVVDDKNIADSILYQALHALGDRAESRGCPDKKERSMPAIVRIFEAITGVKLTEEQGLQFMIAVKLGRAATGTKSNIDDAVDLAGYAALWGECRDRVG